MYDVVNRVSVTYLIHLMHDYEKSLCYIKLYVYNLHHINYIKKNTILFLGLATIWDLKHCSARLFKDQDIFSTS